MSMKRTRIYIVILGMALLLSIRVFVSSGWAAKTEIISFLPRSERRAFHPFHRYPRGTASRIDGRSWTYR